MGEDGLRDFLQELATAASFYRALVEPHFGTANRRVKRVVRSGWRIALLALLMLSTNVSGVASAAQKLKSLPAHAAYGEYAVGVATGFAVDDMARFDPWGYAYASAEYRALLRRIEASGQRRTVVFQLWYPALPRSGENAEKRRPLPAASGRPANFYDFFFQETHELVRLGAAGMVSPEFVHLRGEGPLEQLEMAARQTALDAIGQQILASPQGAWQDANAAPGRFPVILLAHGLGGNHAMWASFAEFLASHGYVVAAPTFVSDGTLPLVFHDENAPFAKAREWNAVLNTYRLMLEEAKVVPYFQRFLFDATPGQPARAGGVEQATTMMRNLFRQRVADVALVLRTIFHMDSAAPDCRKALAAMGAKSAAQPTANNHLCGLLNDRIDVARVGIAGHSLGSMTAQLAANHLPNVRTAFGLNNAPPVMWTPEEMRGVGDPLEVAFRSRKPLFLMVGDEDDFVQDIFIGLFTNALRRAGGKPGQAFPLAAERAAPDRIENPQPVALSAWQQALSDRVLAIVRDTDHGTLVDDVPRMFPWPAFMRDEVPFAQTPARTRKPTGDAAFKDQPPPGESYEALSWRTFADGSQAYLPHVVRDWYALAWFDWHLKGDSAAQSRIAGTDPFGAMTHMRKELR